MRSFIKKEPVLTIASLAAIVSCFFVKPGKEYLSYIDLPVIILLFCLMLVVAGLMKANLFGVISSKILKASDNSRTITLMLVNITFISAMLITNDVALITLVPLTVGLMSENNRSQLILTVVLETVAANLGSMMTPFGNPQNLYLYRFYNMEIQDFLKIVLPYGMLSLVLLNIFTVLLIKKKTVAGTVNKTETIEDKRLLAVYSVMFIVCVLTVLKVINSYICLAVVICACIITGWELLKKVDYFLLLTFCAFFIFVGNMGNIEPVRNTVSELIRGREFLSGILASQIISNVPAAIMLSGFTENAGKLLLGVDAGGLGTLVASLASLISYKQYSVSAGADTKKYMLVFTAINLLFLAVLCVLYICMSMI